MMAAERGTARPPAGLASRVPGSALWTAAGAALAIPAATAAFVSPLIVAAVLLNEPTPVFWGVLVADLVALFAFALFTLSRPVLFIGVLVLWFALQRLVVAIVAPHVEADTVRLLITYKEGFYMVFLVAAAALLLGRIRAGSREMTSVLAADFVALLLLVLLAVELLVSSADVTPRLTYGRRLAAPTLLYLGGRLLIPDRGQLLASIRVVLIVAVGVALFGLAERFVLGIGFWTDTVDAATFYGRQVESGLLPQNWTVIYRGVPDGIFISLPLEVPVRRLVSSYLEPTTLGSFLALALLLALLARGLGRDERPGGGYRLLGAAAVVVLAVALLTTLSRGAMLTVLAGGALFVFVRVAQARAWPSAMPTALGSFVAMTMAAGVVITTLSSFPGDGLVRDALETRAVSGLTDEPPAPIYAPDPQIPLGPLDEITVHPPGSTAEGASKHLDGLRSGLDRMLDEPLGVGLGGAGNWSDAPEAGGESTVGVVAAQLGAPGLLLYVGFYLGVIGALVAAACRSSGPWSDVGLVVGGALFGLFLISFISESSLGLLGNASYFIFAGWILAIASGTVHGLKAAWLPPAAAERSRGGIPP